MENMMQIYPLQPQLLGSGKPTVGLPLLAPLREKCGRAISRAKHFLHQFLLAGGEASDQATIVEGDSTS